MFCRAVLQLRSITHEMARVQLLDIQPGKSYRLEVLVCTFMSWCIMPAAAIISTWQ